LNEVKNLGFLLRHELREVLESIACTFLLGSARCRQGSEGHDLCLYLVCEVEVLIRKGEEDVAELLGLQGSEHGVERRALFGLLLLVDVVEEGGDDMLADATPVVRACAFRVLYAIGVECDYNLIRIVVAPFDLGGETIATPRQVLHSPLPVVALPAEECLLLR